MTHTLGIDVSKKHLDVALLAPNQLRRGQFTNDKVGLKKLARWADTQASKQVQVCLEATGRYSDAAAAFFFERGYRVHVINPARIKAYRQSLLKHNKTDQEDAHLIAHFAASQTLTYWAPPSDHQREIQEISRHLTYLKQERTRLKNRLSSGLRSATVIVSLKTQLQLLEQQIQTLETKLKSLAKTDPSTSFPFKLLVSIIGFGQFTAASLLAEIGDFSRFDSPQQLVAYAGLAPQHFQSGSSVYRKSHISKAGNRHIRHLLFMPALVAIRHNPPAARLAARLALKGKPKKVIICAVMRKLLHFAFAVIKHGQPFDPHYLAPHSVMALDF